MAGKERRTAQRYVVGDLVLEINGIAHETVDISARSVAVVARETVDYGHPHIYARFISESVPALNREVMSLSVTGLRRSLAIFNYAVSDTNWEVHLKEHDVAHDTPLEDIFG